MSQHEQDEQAWAASKTDVHGLDLADKLLGEVVADRQTYGWGRDFSSWETDRIHLAASLAQVANARALEAIADLLEKLTAREEVSEPAPVQHSSWDDLIR